jgi:diadenosine tetraphosphatase ApaH/serine/threonine PP2A family protein phosphatase
MPGLRIARARLPAIHREAIVLIALLTDIHANREALEACLAHAERQNAERYAFLGDLVGYAADPGWVIDTVKEYVARGAIAVLGNHDSAVLSDPDVYLHPEARKAIDWTCARLSHEQLDFLAKLPLTVEAHGCLFVHASAAEPRQWEYVRGISDAITSMAASNCRVTFCGHEHTPALYGVFGGVDASCFFPTDERSIPLDAMGRWLAIPGAVGQPRDRNPAACYAIYDDVRGELRFFRVRYDFTTTAGKILDARLPAVFAWRLAEGV